MKEKNFVQILSIGSPYVKLIILNCFVVKRAYDYDKKVEFGEIVPIKIDRSKYIKSVETIQRAWRRYAARKATKKRIARLEEILNMTIPSWQCRKTFIKDEENFQRQRDLMPIYEAHTKKAISDERMRVNFSIIFEKF